MDHGSKYYTHCCPACRTGYDNHRGEERKGHSSSCTAYKESIDHWLKLCDRDHTYMMLDTDDAAATNRYRNWQHKLVLLTPADIVRGEDMEHPVIHPLKKRLLTQIFINLCLNIGLGGITAVMLADVLRGIQRFRASSRWSSPLHITIGGQSVFSDAAKIVIYVLSDVWIMTYVINENIYTQEWAELVNSISKWTPTRSDQPGDYRSIVQ